MEKLGNHPGSLFHVGFWVEDLEEMHDFLSAYMDVETVIRAPRENGGERLILRDARGQFIELLSEPGKVQARPEIPHHPIGRTAGVTHIAVYTDDTLALKEDVQKKVTRSSPRRQKKIQTVTWTQVEKNTGFYTSVGLLMSPLNFLKSNKRNEYDVH